MFEIFILLYTQAHGILNHYEGKQINSKTIKLLTETLNHPDRDYIFFDINSKHYDSLFLTRLSHGIGIRDGFRHFYSLFRLHASEHFAGDITFLTKKDHFSRDHIVDLSEIFLLLSIDGMTRKNNNEGRDNSLPPDYNTPFFVGSTQTFSGKTLTPEAKKMFFGNEEADLSKLSNGSGIGIRQTFSNNAHIPNKIYWDIENLGVFLSNKSQPTRIEISHPKPIKSLTVEYIPKFDSFEGKKETIHCREYDKKSCIFEVPVNILKKSKAILVTINKYEE